MRWTYVAAALLLLAGCAQENPDPAEPGETQTTTSTTASTTAQPTPPPDPAGSSQDGSCKAAVSTHGDRYVARCTIVRGLDPSATPDVLLKTVSGHIEATHGSKDEASIALAGYGDTEEEARQRLASLDVDVDPDAVSVIVSAPEWRDVMGSITATLTSDGFGDLDLQTVSGHITVDGFHGGTWGLSTTSGHIEATDITADLAASTSSGHITVKGTVGAMVLDTSSGHVTADVTPQTDADWTLDSTSGNVVLKIPEGTAYGYDIEGDTTSGRVQFQTTQMEDVGEQERTHGHKRTTGYDARDIQVTAALDTTSGDVDVVGKGSGSGTNAAFGSI